MNTRAKELIVVAHRFDNEIRFTMEIPGHGFRQRGNVGTRCVVRVEINHQCTKGEALLEEMDLLADRIALAITESTGTPTRAQDEQLSPTRENRNGASREV